MINLMKRIVVDIPDELPQLLEKIQNIQIQKCLKHIIYFFAEVWARDLGHSDTGRSQLEIYQ